MFSEVSETTLLGHPYPTALRLLGFVGRCIFVVQSLPQHQPKSRWIIMFLHSYFWSNWTGKLHFRGGLDWTSLGGAVQPLQFCGMCKGKLN